MNILLSSTPELAGQGLRDFFRCVLYELMQHPLWTICFVIIAGSLMSIAGSLFSLANSCKKVSKNTSSAESVMKFMQNR